MPTCGALSNGIERQTRTTPTLKRAGHAESLLRAFHAYSAPAGKRAPLVKPTDSVAFKNRHLTQTGVSLKLENDQKMNVQTEKHTETPPQLELARLERDDLMSQLTTAGTHTQFSFDTQENLEDLIQEQFQQSICSSYGEVSKGVREPTSLDLLSIINSMERYRV
jgi:hypothetical protein